MTKSQYKDLFISILFHKSHLGIYHGNGKCHIMYIIKQVTIRVFILVPLKGWKISNIWEQP
jgi:hypothetical protein